MFASPSVEMETTVPKMLWRYHATSLLLIQENYHCFPKEKVFDGGGGSHPDT